MIQPDLMKKTILLAVFLFINFHIAIGQTEYEVVRGIYLKANPDTYADDLMLIPAGEIIKKDLSSDYPFIRITYNGEVGYVSINDLKVYSKPEKKKEANHDIIENEGDTIETDTATTPPSNVEPPQETEVVTIPWLEMLWPYLYLLLIIPILFFLVFTSILIRRKSNLKAAKQAIEKATADIKEARAIVEATKLNISAVIDVFNNYSGLDSIITRVKASKVSTDNSIRNVDKLALEIKETTKVIDAVTSTKEALEVRNSAEILKSKAVTANKAASNEKIAVEKEIDSCIGKLKGLTTSAANKAITDANLAKNIINNAKADISVINEIVDTGLTNANKFVSNVSTALKSAKTILERIKTNSDEIKLAAEKVQIKANNAIADTNATSRGKVSVKLAIDAKITAEKATISAATAIAEAKVIKEKSKNLRADAERIKIEVDNAIKDEVKAEEARKQAAIVKQNEEEAALSARVAETLRIKREAVLKTKQEELVVKPKPFKITFFDRIYEPSENTHNIFKSKIINDINIYSYTSYSLRKDVIEYGMTDFDKYFNEIKPYDKVQIYCYFNMRKHFFSSYAIFEAMFPELDNRIFKKNKNLIFIDFGCGPLTSGLGLAAVYKDKKDTEVIKMKYIGIDISVTMRKKAKEFASTNLFVLTECTFLSSLGDLNLLKETAKFNSQNLFFIINACYLFASSTLDESLISNFVSQLQKQFPSRPILFIFQNPDNEDRNKKYYKFKEKVKIHNKPFSEVKNIRYKNNPSARSFSEENVKFEILEL